MGKLMDFFIRKTYEKAKKNVIENIYKNLKCDENLKCEDNFKLFYKDYKKIRHIKYLDKKHEAKEIYEKLINGDSEKLLQEKERMSVEVQSISFPYTSMIIGLIIGVLPNIVVGIINGILLPNIELMKGLYNVLIVIYLSTILFLYSYLILVFDKEAFITTICLNALEELEQEMLEDSKNESYEVLKEVAVTKIEDNNKINRARKIKDRLN